MAECRRDMEIGLNCPRRPPGQILPIRLLSGQSKEVQAPHVSWLRGPFRTRRTKHGSTGDLEDSRPGSFVLIELNSYLEVRQPGKVHILSWFDYVNIQPLAKRADLKFKVVGAARRSKEDLDDVRFPELVNWSACSQMRFDVKRVVITLELEEEMCLIPDGADSGQGVPVGSRSAGRFGIPVAVDSHSLGRLPGSLGSFEDDFLIDRCCWCEEEVFSHGRESL